MYFDGTGMHSYKGIETDNVKRFDLTMKGSRDFVKNIYGYFNRSDVSKEVAQTYLKSMSDNLTALFEFFDGDFWAEQGIDPNKIRPYEYMSKAYENARASIETLESKL